MKDKYGIGNLENHGLIFPKEKVINDKQLNRFRDSMDKVQGRDHVLGDFFCFEVNNFQLGISAYNIYSTVTETVHSKLPTRSIDTFHMFYQINARSEEGEGKAPIISRVKRGYTVLFAITKLDV